MVAFTAIILILVACGLIAGLVLTVLCGVGGYEDATDCPGRYDNTWIGPWSWLYNAMYTLGSKERRDKRLNRNKERFGRS